MKSEHLKTELITNVSHDIKTPITSIVNYVDLLKKEPLPEGPAREYVAVLDRQSQRLKKLTEDLVEASKAATGNIPVVLEPTDLHLLLGQVVGEYAPPARGVRARADHGLLRGFTRHSGRRAASVARAR